MKIDVKEITKQLTAHFSDNIVYQPLLVDDDAVRPVAQLVRSAQILQSVVSDEPRTLTLRQNSALHLKGILHHNAPARKTGES